MLQFKLTPILFLWLIPNENPEDVVKEIDAALASDESQAKQAQNDGSSDGAAEAPAQLQAWDFSGWPMLLLPMPPIGLMQIAQPIKNSLNMGQAVLALPVLLLILVPGYQHFVKEKGRGWIVGGSSTDSLAEGLTAGGGSDGVSPDAVSTL
jgi:hypothetical protein